MSTPAGILGPAKMRQVREAGFVVVRKSEVGEVTSTERDAMQEDVAEMLRTLGLGDHARPKSCHEVIQDEILPEVRRLKGETP